LENCRTTSPGAKLDVAGGIKVADDASTCTSSNAGTIRWTGTTLQVCNGTTWLMLENAPPSLASVDPTTGATRGGYTITLTGSDFNSPATVDIAGISATDVTAVSSTTITATVPASTSTGAKDIKITNPDGRASTLSGALTYQASGESSALASASCKTIMGIDGGSIGNDTYWTTAYGTASAFQAYCNMTDNEGGWVLVWKSGPKGTQNSSTGAVGTFPQPTHTDFHKFSDTIINALRQGGGTIENSILWAHRPENPDYNDPNKGTYLRQNISFTNYANATGLGSNLRTFADPGNEGSTSGLSNRYISARDNTNMKTATDAYGSGIDTWTHTATILSNQIILFYSAEGWISGNTYDGSRSERYAEIYVKSLD